MSEATAEKRIIDAHVHVWTDDTESYPLASGFTKEDLWHPRFTPEDHFAYSRSVGRVRINLVQMTWYGLDHTYILDLIRGDPETFVGTGIVPAVTDVSLASPDKTMVALSEGGVYAFRVRGGYGGRPSLNDRPHWLDHEGYEKMFAAGAEHNLALSFLASSEDMAEVGRMCAKHPETPVILDHVPGVRVREGVFSEEALQTVCGLARHKRVMVKLGPIHALSEQNAPFLDTLPIVERLVNAFGPERCMWESDSGGPVEMEDPATDYPAAIALIRDHCDFLSESDKDYILFRTAEDFFFNR